MGRIGLLSYYEADTLQDSYNISMPCLGMNLSKMIAKNRQMLSHKTILQIGIQLVSHIYNYDCEYIGILPKAIAFHRTLTFGSQAW